MSEQFSTEYTDNAVCPFCGYVERDSWEIGDGEGETEHTCGRCDKAYGVSRHMQISYTTYRLKEKP